MRCFLLLLFCALASQVPAQKTPTPEQPRYQADVRAWTARHFAFAAHIREALEAERTRAKLPTCTDASTTMGAEACLSPELELLQANLRSLVTNLRASLADPYPAMPGEQPATGPTGTARTAAERSAQISELEAAADRYRTVACQAAYDQFKGGTFAPVAGGECTVRLLRSHMEDLAEIYDEQIQAH